MIEDGKFDKAREDSYAGWKELRPGVSLDAITKRVADDEIDPRRAGTARRMST